MRPASPLREVFSTRADQTSALPLDHREMMHRDEKDRNDDLEEALLDAQGTIGQFRDLVLSMQTCVPLPRRRQPPLRRH